MCSSGGGWRTLGQWHPAFSSLKELKQKNVSRALLKKKKKLVSWYRLASLAWTSLLVLLISTHHSIVPPLTITHLWARVDHVILASGNVLREVTRWMEKHSMNSLRWGVAVNSFKFSRSNLVSYCPFDSSIYEMKANSLFMAPRWRVHISTAGKLMLVQCLFEISNNIFHTKWDKLNLCNYIVAFSKYFVNIRNHKRPYALVY